MGEKWHCPMRSCKHRFAEALHAAHPPRGEPLSQARVHTDRLGRRPRTGWLSPLQGAYCERTRPNLLPEGAGPIHLNKRRKARGSTRSQKNNKADKRTLHQTGVLCSWKPAVPNSVLFIRQQEKSGYDDSQELMKIYGSQERLGSVNTLSRGAQACLLCLCKKASYQS